MASTAPPRGGPASDLDPRKVILETTGGGDAEPRPRSDGRVDPLIGRIIEDKYRVQAFVAQGGMGRIYRAEQIPLGRIVALKVLRPRPGAAQDDSFERRFLLEASTCAKLTHPNTVTLFDYGQLSLGARRTFYMVMEYVQGRTLADVLRQEGPFPVHRALNIAAEICRSLHEAHQVGIVHRDLKPSNIMLVRRDGGESVKVLDFGVAKVLEEDPAANAASDPVMGSPRYMSPEQIRHLDLDGRSDLYSLGVLMFLMLTGQVPYAKEGLAETLMAHLTEPIPSVAERSGRPVHPAVEALVRRCMEKVAKDRYPNAQALREAIESALAALPPEGDTGLPSAFEGPAVRMSPAATTSLSDEATQGTLTQVDVRPPPARPVTPAPTSRIPTSVLVAAGVIGGILLLFVVISMLRPKDAPEESPPTAATTLATAPLSAPRLTLASTPAGAAVLEGTEVLGKTPLEVPLDRPQTRNFTLRLDGYQSAQVTQPPVTTDTRQDVTLQKNVEATGANRGNKPSGSNASGKPRKGENIIMTR